MEVTLILRNCSIISVNSSHYGINYRKTTETQKALFAAKVQLIKQKHLIQKIKESFNPTRHFLRITYCWFVPEKRYFTKAGTMAQRVGDWSNFPKLYDDLIANEVLDIDDSQIKRGVVNILPYPYPTDSISVTISIGEVESLKDAWKKLLPEALK